MIEKLKSIEMKEKVCLHLEKHFLKNRLKIVFFTIKLFPLLFLFNSTSILAQKPVLTIPSGQNSRIFAAKITPDGRYFLSAAVDRSIKIYDLKEKNEIFTFWEHTSYADDIAIAPNNRTVVSVADGGEILIWDLYSGKVKFKIENYGGAGYKSITIHPNGKTFLIANGGIVSEFDLLTGKLIIEEQYHDVPINKIAYIKNGEEFYTSAKDDSRLDSIINLIQTKTIDKDITKNLFWKSAIYQSTSFSQDGQTRYDVTNNPDELRISHLDEQPIKIAIENYTPFEVEVLSKDYLLIVCRKNEEISFLLFNLTNFKIDKTIDTNSFYGAEFVDKYGGNFKFQIVPNKKDEVIYTTTLYDSKVYHTNLSTGITSLYIANKTHGYTPCLINDQLFLGGYNSNLTKWNLINNQISNVFSSKKGITITPLNDVNLLTENKKIFIWDKDLTSVKDSLVLDEIIFGLFPNPDKTKILANFGGKPMYLDLSNAKTKTLDFISENWYSSDWIDENKLVFLSEIDKKAHLFFTTKDKIEKKIPIKFKEDLKLDPYCRFIVNRFNNTLLFTQGFNGVLTQISQDGKILIDKKISDGQCNLLEYDNKLQQIIVSFDNGEILFINPQTLEVVKRLKGHEAEVDSILISDDTKKVFSFSLDNTIKIWGYQEGKLLSTLVLLDNKEWVVMNENGLFDASPQAMKDIYYVVNEPLDEEEPWKIIELNQLKHRYYQPDLLQIQLGYKKEQLRTPIAINEIPLAPKVSTNLIDNKLNVTIKNQNGGIGKVVLFIENAEVVADIRPKGKGDQDINELSVLIDLDLYKNRYSNSKDINIKLIAWNKEEWLSSKPEIIIYKPLQSKGAIATSTTTKTDGEIPKLFGLVVGTSDYTGQQIDLTYAAKDAIDFANALRISAENLFDKKNSFIEILSSDNKDINSKPTRNNILKRLNELEAKIKPNDILVVYLSGHGVNFGGSDGDFYYLTQEASGADAAYLNDEGIRNSATISSSELTKLLNKTIAKKKILILDACASGKAAEKMSASKDVPASQIRALDRMQDRTGFYILAGSAADAVSYESSIYGQGLLTYSLLKAIKGSALRVDGNEEYVDVQKLFQFAVDEVPNLSKNIGGIQKPFYRSPDNQQSFDIGKVDLNTKKNIIISEPKPVFIEAVFSDSESLYDELGLSDIFNSNLQEIAAKGKNADIAFMRVKEYPDAYRISGTYTSNNETINLKYRIISNKKTIGDIENVTITKSDNSNDAINKIIQSISEKIKLMKTL